MWHSTVHTCVCVCVYCEASEWKSKKRKKWNCCKKPNGQKKGNKQNVRTRRRNAHTRGVRPAFVWVPISQKKKRVGVAKGTNEAKYTYDNNHSALCLIRGHLSTFCVCVFLPSLPSDRICVKQEMSGGAGIYSKRRNETETGRRALPQEIADSACHAKFNGMLQRMNIHRFFDPPSFLLRLVKTKEQPT